MTHESEKTVVHHSGAEAEKQKAENRSWIKALEECIPLSDSAGDRHS